MSKDNLEDVLTFLKTDIKNCLYMYADICKYGLDNDFIDLWIDDLKKINLVVMRYHKGFQIFGNVDNLNVSNIINLIEYHKPNAISAKKEIVLGIKDDLCSDYHDEYGVVFQAKSIDIEKSAEILKECPFDIKLAVAEDAENIAKLLLLDENLGGAYTAFTLSEELRERISTGMGRSYIICDRENVVAHNATYAESDEFVIVSGLMVHPLYRDNSYAYWIDLKSTYEFSMEGKSRFCFAIEPKIIKLYKRMGAIIVTEYGRLTRNIKV